MADSYDRVQPSFIATFHTNVQFIVWVASEQKGPSVVMMPGSLSMQRALVFSLPQGKRHEHASWAGSTTSGPY